uniref:Uncharacterized protein n=1 Tax=Lotharella oceanica TaxID=641309 RepID=A0A7S2X8D4_9EUKA|mmetsp:Transcript_17470/g.33141  ORF Transcript_17470/g.33141 Transcript_17470/m.33141 type:complete len:120 (+) Transcript_17470:603-962(+)
MLLYIHWPVRSQQRPIASQHLPRASQTLEQQFPMASQQRKQAWHSGVQQYSFIASQQFPIAVHMGMQQLSRSTVYITVQPSRTFSQTGSIAKYHTDWQLGIQIRTQHARHPQSRGRMQT